MGIASFGCYGLAFAFSASAILFSGLFTDLLHGFGPLWLARCLRPGRPEVSDSGVWRHRELEPRLRGSGDQSAPVRCEQSCAGWEVFQDRAFSFVWRCCSGATAPLAGGKRPALP